MMAIANSFVQSSDIHLYIVQIKSICHLLFTKDLKCVSQEGTLELTVRMHL